MQTRNLIQAQANVIKITSLVKGNVIKILEKEYQDTFKTHYGVVIDLLNSGKDSFVTLLTYEKSYGELKAKIVTYSGKTDLNIFPADPQEVKDYFADTIKQVESDVKKKQKELSDLKDGLEKAREFVSGELSQKLLATSFEEISQVEYDKKVREIEEAKSDILTN